MDTEAPKGKKRSKVVQNGPRSTKPEPVKTVVVREHVSGKSNRQIAREVGIERKTVANIIQEVKRTAAEVFDAHGLTLDSLAEDVHRLRRAKRIQFFPKDGIVIDQKETEALDIQLKAVDLGLQVQGAYKKPEDAPANTAGSPRFVVNMGFLTPERAKAILGPKSGSGGDL